MTTEVNTQTHTDGPFPDDLVGERVRLTYESTHDTEKTLTGTVEHFGSFRMERNPGRNQFVLFDEDNGRKVHVRMMGEDRRVVGYKSQEYRLGDAISVEILDGD